MFFTALAAVTLLILIAILFELVSGERRLHRLGTEPLPDASLELPSVSVVVAARDEARGIEAALRSMLGQDHPRLDLIVVDDRSEDDTPAILERLAREQPRLRVVTVSELPAGWLGKNHALHVGAAAATGELLLFTDADIVMDPTTVRRAVAHLEREGLDHLTLGPRVILPGWFLETFLVLFGIMFALFARPWRAADPDDPAHVGIGAFNLIRASAYRTIGGHEPIRMRPDDDLKLGKLVKKHRLRQGFVMGAALVSVEWYHSLGEVVRGLRKNAFAGTDYRVWMVLLATALHLALFVWPFLAVFVLGGTAGLLNTAAVVLVLLMYAGAAYHQRLPVWRGVAVPLASVLFLVVLWNSMRYTLSHRGIEWRGTHYPLEELRANRV